MQQSGVYVIENQCTRKVYVGSAYRMEYRRQRHFKQLTEGRHHSKKLQRSWDKHGPGVFRFRPVLVCSKANLLMYEQIVIDWHDAYRKGYNCLPRAGSRAGMKASPEHRAKIAEGLRKSGRIWGPPSPETRTKIGAASRGRKASAETRKKQSEGRRGYRHMPDAIENMRAAQSNRKPVSDETRQRMSDAAKRRREREQAAGIERQFSPEFMAHVVRPGQKRDLVITEETRRRKAAAARNRRDLARNEKGQYVAPR